MQCPPTIRIGNNSQFTFLNPTHAFHFISPAHVYGSIFQPINKYTYTIYNTTMRVYKYIHPISAYVCRYTIYTMSPNRTPPQSFAICNLQQGAFYNLDYRTIAKGVW